MSVKEAEDFKKLVDKNGLPIFVKAVFPPRKPGDYRQAGWPLATMLKLVIANKLYSSWSLRPWMVLSAFEIPFEEIVIPLRAARQQKPVARILSFWQSCRL